jgi:class 3 adenylate cyclase/broad specificity phosphatase PhoE/putative methionine-R-sulfoxide reductase with GAF domain
MVELVYETHALTVDNETGFATGWLPGELSEKGRLGARELGERRRNDGIACVFCSDLERAVDTAEIAFAGSGLEVRHDARLRECNYGALNGARVELIEPREAYIDRPYPGGESWRQAVDRLRDFLDEVGPEFEGRRILVIAHGAQRYGTEHLLRGRLRLARRMGVCACVNDVTTTDPAELARELEAAREQQRSLGRVLRAIGEGRGLEPVLDELIEAATKLCNGEYAELHLVEGESLRAFSFYVASDVESPIARGAREQWDLSRPELHARDRTTLAGRVALLEDVVDIPDMLADPDYNFPLPAGTRAGLGVPIVLDGELIGTIGIVRGVDSPFTEDDTDLVRTFADQAAVAIRNARLLETVQRQLEQQRAVSEVLGAVARREGLQAVLDEVVEQATRLSGSENGRLWLLEGVAMHAFANYGSTEGYEYEKQHPLAPDRTTMTGRVALTREVVHIPDTSLDPDYAYEGPVHFRAGLSVPILLEDELIGAIGVVRPEAGPFADDQIELVKIFADQAAIAIANTRLIEAVERQRTELTRFVSPQVAQLLSSDEGEKLLAGHRAYISVMFCDLRGFTSFTETAEPEELFEVLREYHAVLGRLIPEYGGTLEHFAGDGLMVFFNDPVAVGDHELAAIRLALAAHGRFHDLAAGWEKRGHMLGLGIGITAGYATLGRIGFEGRYDYGALGRVTNLASRLSSAAKTGQTLVGQRLYAAVEEQVDAEPVGELELKGFREPVAAYEVRGLR